MLHRQFQSGAAVGDLGALQRARSQGPDDVRPDDRGLLDLHRQPGHRAGHLRDLRRDGPPALRRQPRAASGFSPPASAAWAARSRSPRPWPAPRCWPWSASRAASPSACRPAIWTRRPRRSTRRWRCSTRAPRAAKPISVGLLGNAAECCRELLRRGITPGRRHRSDLGARSGQRLPAAGLDARSSGIALRARDPDAGRREAARASMARARRVRCSSSSAQGIPVFDYGNNIRQVAFDEGVAGRLRLSRLRARLHPAAVLPRHRPVPLGRALGRSGGHLPHRREGQGADARRPASASLAGHGARAHPVPGSAGAHLLGRTRRPPPARASPSTRWWRAAS